MHKRAIDYVDVFIGTTGSGKALIGPQMPHGMAKLCPDTISLPNGGYDFCDGKILCFSHTHMEGSGGWGNRGNVALMPANGSVLLNETDYASAFSHESETARVGYYSVLLEKYGITAEMTASAHCGLHRYSFPARQDPRVILDMGHTLGRSFNCDEAYVEIVSDTEVRGWGVYPHNAYASPSFKIYFCLKTSHPFRAVVFGEDAGNRRELPAPPLKLGLAPLNPNNVQGVLKEFAGETVNHSRRAGALLCFDGMEGRQVSVKVGISYIDANQAADTLGEEIPGFDFDDIRVRCENAWEALLSKITVEARGDLKTRYYSALYRALNQPGDHTEQGRYMMPAGGQAKIKDAKGRRYYSDIWVIWDTFRTVHPMLMLFEPDIVSDICASLVDYYTEGGWLPLCCTPALGYVKEMVGHNANSVLLDAYMKGHRDFDLDKALEAMKKANTSVGEYMGITEGYARCGFIPGDDNNFAVTHSLELIYSDWCIAQLAKALGREDDYRFFIGRAGNYAKLFDPQKRFMRRRYEDGRWVEPFDPTDGFKNGFCESSTYEGTFFVPHDIQGLMNLMGGSKSFIERLDSIYENHRTNYENETSINLPFLYNYARAPYKTAEVCRRFLKNFFTCEKDGLYGEDDDGAMSAFFAFMYMGLYPSCPGQNIYNLASPTLDAWSIALSQGRRFSVRAINNSDENIYIQSATLNGQPYNKSYITYEDVTAGGELVFRMGNTPSDWATAADSAALSMTCGEPDFECVSLSAPADVDAGKPFILTAALRNKGVKGTCDLKVLEGGRTAGRAFCTLDAEATDTFTVECTLYDAETRSISALGFSVPVRVMNPMPGGLECVSLRSDKRFVPQRYNSPFRVTATVRNTGSFTYQAAPEFIVDGLAVSRKAVALPPAGTADIEFEVLLANPGTHYASVCGCAPIELDVAVPPHAFHITMANTPAEFYTSGKNYYISASGNQGSEHYGIIFRRDKVEGDFNVTVKLTAEDNTSPYAPAGIVIRNELGDPNAGYTGGLYMGAMSVRGFYCYLDTPQELFDEPVPWAQGCPKTPCWLKVEKCGKHFTCSYSLDGVHFVKKAGGLIEQAGFAQYVGIYARSCIHDQRLVKFTDFIIQSRA